VTGSYVALGLALATSALAGDAGSATTSLGVGIGRHDSPRQVVIGTGPQLSHRQAIQDSWFWGAGVERIWLVVPSVGLRAEAGLQRRKSSWHPTVSAEVGTWLGRLALLSTDHPAPPLLPPTSLRLRVRPLCWSMGDHAEVSALELSSGLSLEAPLATRSFALTLFSLGHQW